MNGLEQILSSVQVFKQICERRSKERKDMLKKFMETDSSLEHAIESFGKHADQNEDDFLRHTQFF